MRSEYRKGSMGDPGRGSVNKTTVLSLLIIGCLSFVVILSMATASEDSDAATCDNIKVYVEEADGEYTKVTVGGVSTVREAIESALDKLGKTYEYGNEGKFTSVDGRTLDEDHYWRIHQWLPLGTAGWGLMSYDSTSDSYMNSGCSYCLHVSTMSDKSGSNVYSVPDFKPVSTGYVFIRFANGYDAENETVQSTFTADVRKEGFWLSGSGSSLAAVLEDAVTSQGLQIELSNFTDGNGNVLRGWILSMFGIGDDSVGGGNWAYWSQWIWNGYAWSYNSWTLGYYDPAVYKYVECIYLISAVDPYSGEYKIDKGGAEPNPDTDKIECIKINNKVTFKANGRTVATQTVRYGQTADLSKVQDPTAPEGKTFAGWGDVMSPIVRDTTFTAKFEDSATQYTVRYYDETGKVLLYTEKVDAGSAATYSGKPAKQDDDKYTYTFKGWSADLSSVTSDIDVTPVYEKKEKKSDDDDPSPAPHTHSWGSGIVTKEPTCTEKGVKTYTCSCGKTKQESIPATGHQWSEWVVTKEATATEEGQKERTCGKCGAVETQVIERTDGHVHSWGDGEVTKNPTCTEKGVKTYTCSCGQTKTEEIPATGHTWSEWTVTKQATATEKGLKQRTCEACGETEEADIEPKGTDPKRYEDEGSETVVTPDGDGWKVVTKIDAVTVQEDGRAVTQLDSSAIDSAVRRIVSVGDPTAAMSVTIRVSADIVDAKGTELVIPSGDVAKLLDAGDFVIEYVTDASTVRLDSATLSAIKGEDVSLSFSGDRISDADGFPTVSDGFGIDVTLLSGGKSVHELAGTLNVGVPYAIPDSKDAKDLRVWYVDGGELKAVDSSYDAESGTVSFDTDHCSKWIIGFASGNSDSGSEGSGSMMIVAGIAVVVIACIAVAAIVKRK